MTLPAVPPPAPAAPALLPPAPEAPPPVDVSSPPHRSTARDATTNVPTKKPAFFFCIESSKNKELLFGKKINLKVARATVATAPITDARPLRYRHRAVWSHF
jgi:hypothetical protein